MLRQKQRFSKGGQYLLLLLILLCTPLFAKSQTNPSPLPVDQAFVLSVHSPDPQHIIVQWDIQPHYYLYENKLQFQAIPTHQVQLGAPDLPPAMQRSHPLLGDFLAYQGKIIIPIPIRMATTNQFELRVHFQGCSEYGYCYPPTERTIPMTLLKIDRIPDNLSLNPTTTTTTTKQTSWMMWLGFFGLGLLISLTPCVLPMIPILSGLIVGKKEMSHLHAFFISLAYVLGMAITYAMVGFLMGTLGSNLQAILQKPWIIVIFSGIFILMACSLFGFYQIQLPEKLRSIVARLSAHQKKGNLLGATIMGCLSTLILSPCATPALIGLLGYISQTGHAYLGAVAFFVVALGMGVPLLFVGAFGRRLLPKPGPWMRVVENFLGILLLGVAIWMLARILPDHIVMMLWATLAIGISVYLKTFSTVTQWRHRLSKALGLVVFIVGILGFAHAIQGQLALCAVTQSSHAFIPVKTIADVQAQLQKAKNKPVILDFYADWCVSCQLMEKNVFGHLAVQKALENVIQLRADITANDKQDILLMRHFNVIAPPTILFFNQQHQELTQSRIIGEISATDFIARIPEDV